MAVHQLPRALSAVVAAALCGSLAVACSSGDDGTPVIPLVPPAATSVIAPAQSAVCAAERATLQVAIEAYQALTGTAPADEKAMVDEGILADESVLFDVRDGAIVAAAAGGCV